MQPVSDNGAAPLPVVPGKIFYVVQGKKHLWRNWPKYWFIGLHETEKKAVFDGLAKIYLESLDDPTIYIPEAFREAAERTATSVGGIENMKRIYQKPSGPPRRLRR